MKKLFTFLTLFALTAAVYAQSYSDDFDSYAAGDYMGVVNPDNWSTWSGNTGAPEGAPVSDAQSHSGANSIYIHSTTVGGGPTDAILNIGDNLSDGVLTFGSQMYITGGKVGYFNLQATPTPGTTWTLNFQAQDGQIVIDEAGPPLVVASYNDDEWFEWEIVANMTFNIWQVYINSELVGTFSSAANQVSAADIFAIDNADFWIDDIHFDWQPLTLPETNLSALSLTGIGALAGLEYHPIASVRNNGLNEITSFDIEMENNGSTSTQSISGVSLASGEYMDILFDDVVVPDPGQQEMSATVSNVNNAGADDYADDDTYVLLGTYAAAATGKRAVVEEGTGTWCQWCPRGAVTMARMSETYGENYVGIAVHNGDPMTVTDYDAGLGITAFPGGKVDRGPQLSDGQFEPKWIERMQVAPKAYVNVGAQYDADTRFLQVVLEMECVEGAAGMFKPGLVIVEDGVTGTGSAYAQVNAYSGGDVAMGGYEDLPNPVPANMMVYDHVGRAILPDYNGADNVLPDPIETGVTYAVNFEMTVPEEWDVANLKLVGMFYGPSRIDNSYEASLADAIDNGWYDSGNNVTGINQLPEPDATIKLYPNPATNNSFIDLGLKAADEVTVTILTVEGKVVSHKEYGVLSGATRLPIHTANFESGLYMVQIRIGNTQTVKKLLVD